MAVYTIDIELTNRCNADCYFCPRDATPHQGLMSEATFDQALIRAAQIRESNWARDPDMQTNISFCGLGEPLLHKQAPEFIRRATEQGFTSTMSSNASLLDERRGQAVLDAGLSTLCANIGERDQGYVDIYKLPFEKTRDNLIRFAEMAGDRCEVLIVLVDHRRDKAHVAEMERYWRGYGFKGFATFDIMNRGGALFVDHMQYETRPELATAQSMIAARQGEALCTVPFLSTFVGYDGNIYLCCSDWKKEAVVANVWDDAADYLAPKFDFVTSRDPVCRSCNLDPLNALVDELRATADGEPDAKDPELMADEFARFGPVLRAATADDIAAAPNTRGRRLIPVRPA
jgi:MoaA/NifB/PqqE/SkfB family radical SAM enzyme